MFPLVKGGVNTPSAKLACGALATPLYLSLFVDGPEFEASLTQSAAIWVSKDDMRRIINSALSGELISAREVTKSEREVYEEN